MTSPVVRAATIQDAEAAVAVLRDSIARLCVADHRNDAATLEWWLRNKTADHFRAWLADPDTFLVVAEVESVLSGVGMVDVRGEVRLCYVSPGQQGRGIGRALLRTLEARASQWRLGEIRLSSSAEARPFYEHHGFRSSGDAVSAFGVLRVYPYVKALQTAEAEVAGLSFASLNVRAARPLEAPVVLSILREASAWLEQRGIPLWTEAQLDPATISADVNAGHYALAFRGDLAVGTARLTLDDPLFWPDAVANDAAYLHRLAVRRSHAGGVVSAAVLDWALARAAELGRSFLRLDCDANRPRLRALYQRFGFEFHSVLTVGPYFVARYQKATAF